MITPGGKPVCGYSVYFDLLFIRFKFLLFEAAVGSLFACVDGSSDSAWSLLACIGIAVVDYIVAILIPENLGLVFYPVHSTVNGGPEGQDDFIFGI